MSYKYKEYLKTTITTVVTHTYGYSEIHPLTHTYITLSPHAICTTLKSDLYTTLTWMSRYSDNR
jgi:hypothetical protein